MRSKTYAYNSILIGAMLALLVWAKTQSIVLAVLTLAAVSVVGFLIIRAIENMIAKGVDAAGDAISKAMEKKKEQSRQDENKGGL